MNGQMHYKNILPYMPVNFLSNEGMLLISLLFCVICNLLNKVVSLAMTSYLFFYTVDSFIFVGTDIHGLRKTRNFDDIYIRGFWQS